MSTPRKQQKPAVNVTITEPSIKAISLRVPERIHDQAKICADVCGIPLNGLVCVALAEYLSARGYKVHPLH